MTIQITKVSVSKVQDKMYSIVLNMKCMDGETELINQDFSGNHKIGNTVDYTINRFKEKMQKAIDDYKEEQNIFNSAQLDSAILTLQSGLIP